MPRAVQFDLRNHPWVNPQHRRWGNPPPGILKHNQRSSAPGASRNAMPSWPRIAAEDPMVNQAHSCNAADHCACQYCQHYSDQQPFTQATNPSFPVPHGQQRDHQRHPIQPQLWRYPAGTWQWTPNTFTGANSTIPLPPVEPIPDTASCAILINWDISRRRFAGAPDTALQRLALQQEYHKVTVDVGSETDIPGWASVWGRLRVKADSPTGISVKNLMDAIYNYFHTRLSEADLCMVHPDDCEPLWQACTKRINSRRGRRRLVDPHPRRIDLLLGRQYFKSLAVVSFQGKHCKVVLGLGRNPTP